MPKPTGQQWVRLYRGLHMTDPEHVEAHPKVIGSHWSSNSDIAYNFATNRDIEGYPHYDWGDEDPIPMKGTVVEALVHPRHIIDPESDEGQDWQMHSEVFGPDHSEQERTVRPGAPVHVQKLHYFDDDNETSRTVKPTKRKGFRA